MNQKQGKIKRRLEKSQEGFFEPQKFSISEETGGVLRWIKQK